jgi:hypothetical protein
MGATMEIINVVLMHIFVLFPHLASNMGPAITVAVVHQ